MDSIEMSAEMRKQVKLAYARGYKKGMRIGKNKSELMENLETLVVEGGEIIKSLIQASMSNPIIGLGLTMALTDVAYNLKVINLPTVIGIWTMVGVIEGANVAGQIITDFASITQFFGSRPANTDNKPSLTTLVLGKNEAPTISDKNDA